MAKSPSWATGGGSSSGGGSASPKVTPPKRSLFGTLVHGAEAPLRLGKRGLVDAEHLVTGVPRAIVATAQTVPEVVKATWEVPQTSLAHGHVPFTKYKAGQEAAINLDLQKKLPRLFGLATAQAQTLRDVGLGRALTHETRSSYTQDPLKLYSEHPLSALVNDVANLAPVVGGVARVTAPLAEEAGAAGRAAGGVQRLASGANKIASAPIEAYKLPFKLPGKLGDLAGESLQKASVANEAGLRARAFPGARVLARLSPDSQTIVNELSRMHAEEQSGRTEPAKLQAQVEHILPSAHEQQAATLVGEHVAPSLATLREHVGPDKFEHHINQRFKGTLTAEAANMAADVASGRNPELAGRIAQAHQLQQSAPAVQGGQLARAEAYTAQPGHEWQAGFVPKEGETGLTAEPARLRPALAEAQATGEHLTSLAADLRARGLPEQAAAAEAAVSDLPRTGTDLQAAGQNPQHYFHTQSGGTKPLSGGQLRRLSLPKLAQAGSERLRTGSPAYDRTAAGQARGAAELNVQHARFATADRVAAKVGTKLGEGALAGASTPEEAIAHGYVPFRPFEEAGRGVPVPSPNDVYVPKYLDTEFRSYFAGPSKAADIARVVGLPNRAFYAARLALTPALITGRLLGHAMLGFSQTSDPLALASNIVRVVRHWKSTGEFPAPTQLAKGEAYTAEAADLANERAGMRGLAGKVAGAGNKVLRQPFRLAGFMDNVERSAFYMTELGKNLTRTAADEGTKLGGISKVGRTAAQEQALTTALRAMGDFNRMSPFEQNVVRQYIPMYRWHKELTRIAFHLAEDHPMRLAWTLHLADMLGKPETAPGGDITLPLDPNAHGTPTTPGANDRFKVGTYPDTLPSYWANALPVGNRLLGTGLLNPFAETTSLFGGGLKGMGKFLGPIPRLAATQLTGISPTTGKNYFRPPGTRTMFGHPAPPSIIEQLKTMAPQTRLFNALTGRDKIQRYASGEPYVPGAKKGKVPEFVQTGGTPLQGLASFAGINVGNRKLIETQQAKHAATSDKTLTSAQRQAENYRRKVKAARTGTKYVPLPTPKKPSSGGKKSSSPSWAH